MNFDELWKIILFINHTFTSMPSKVSYNGANSRQTQYHVTRMKVTKFSERFETGFTSVWRRHTVENQYSVVVYSAASLYSSDEHNNQHYNCILNVKGFVFGGYRSAPLNHQRANLTEGGNEGCYLRFFHAPIGQPFFDGRQVDEQLGGDSGRNFQPIDHQMDLG